MEFYIVHQSYTLRREYPEPVGIQFVTETISSEFEDKATCDIAITGTEFEQLQDELIKGDDTHNQKVFERAIERRIRQLFKFEQAKVNYKDYEDAIRQMEEQDHIIKDQGAALDILLDTGGEISADHSE